MKTALSPSVFAVGPNNTKLKVADEASAAALYGAAWAKLVRDLPDVFDSNYAVGAALSDSMPHDGMLLKVADSSVVYAVRGGLLYAVDGSLSVAAASDVRTVSAAVLAKLSKATSTVTAGSVLDNPAQKAAGTTTPAPTVGTFSVSLAGNTPAGSPVPKNGSRVPFTTVTLTAGAAGASVETLYVKRTGLSASTDFSKVWAEKAGVRVSSQQGLNASTDDATLTFSPALAIAANSSITLDIVASLSGGSNVYAAALGVAASSAGTPVYGGSMTFTAYVVGTATATLSNAKNPKVGEENTELATLEVTASKDSYFHSITLKNDGNEDMVKVLTNLRLEKNGSVVSEPAVFSGRYTTFNLKSGGLLIESGDTLTLKLKASVIGKDNASGVSLLLKINKNEDVSIVEKTTGFGVSVTASADTVSDTFVAGALVLTKKTTSPTDADVIIGSKSVLALVANVKADQAISSEGLNLKADFSGTYSHFENAKVTINGVSLGTVSPTSTMLFDTSYNVQ